VARTSDRVRAIFVALTAVAQVVVGSFGGPNTGSISDANASPITPAGWAFGIWILIYAGCLALAVYQLVPSQQHRRVHRRSGWWLVGAFSASTLWVPIFGARVLWLAQIVIVLLAVCLVFAARGFLLTGPARTASEIGLLRLPVMLYLGWVTVATAAGFATTFRSWGMPASARWVIEICVVLVLSAAIMSLFVVGRLLAVAGFLLAACWGLVAVAVNTAADSVRLAAILAIVVLVSAVFGRTLRSPERRAVLLG
jgi:benzodiazapine receptor